LIVHSWRFSDWPEGHYGTCLFSLKSIERTSGDEKSFVTKLNFRLENIPQKKLESSVTWFDKFWKKFVMPNLDPENSNLEPKRSTLRLRQIKRNVSKMNLRSESSMKFDTTKFNNKY